MVFLHFMHVEKLLGRITLAPPALRCVKVLNVSRKTSSLLERRDGVISRRLSYHSYVTQEASR